MTDEDLRGNYLDRTIQAGTFPNLLWGEFEVDNTDGDSQLFNVPRGTRVIDGYAEVVTACTGSTPNQDAEVQVETAASSESAIIAALALETAALTRMVAGGAVLVDDDGEKVIKLKRSGLTGTVSTKATIRVYLLLTREEPGQTE